MNFCQQNPNTFLTGLTTFQTFYHLISWGLRQSPHVDVQHKIHARCSIPSAVALHWSQLSWGLEEFMILNCDHCSVLQAKTGPEQHLWFSKKHYFLAIHTKNHHVKTNNTSHKVLKANISFEQPGHIHKIKNSFQTDLYYALIILKWKFYFWLQELKTNVLFRFHLVRILFAKDSVIFQL